ncbi:MAG: trehalase family glycosidase [Pseudomonadota bacterium]
MTALGKGSAPLTNLVELATAILKENDRGLYSVPTSGLYPFQWNWDSCLTALGQAWNDENRAWTEVATLMDHQWPDGMVPHIIFHREDDSYFPGPDVWDTGRPVPTSGITQPPIAGFVIRRLFERARDMDLAERRVRELLPKVAAWHDWFHNTRDPGETGLVAILHPWESGRDNSIDWDEALARVPDDGVAPYVRKDTSHVDHAQRPTKVEYDRYLWLLQHFRSLDWDNTQLHDASPFRMVDPALNSILIRSEDDVAWLAEQLGQPDLAASQRANAEAGRKALEKLWSDEHGQYVCFDRVSSSLVDSASVGGFLPFFAGIDDMAHRAALADRLRELLSRVRFFIPSHDPSDPRFDGLRYWRGPAWFVVNYLIVDGLSRAGEVDLAKRITESSLELAERGDLSEYYDPHTGRGLGGGEFTWTAAMVLEFLKRRDA